MLNPLTSVVQYPPDYYLENLQAYNCHAGVDKLIEFARMLVAAGQDYLYRGMVFPLGSEAPTVAAGKTIEGTISIPAGSFLYSHGGYSNQNEGFKYSLFDKGSKTYLVDKEFVHSGLDATDSQPDVDVASSNIFHISPFVITAPGLLQVQITNLSGVDAVIQLFLEFAVPNIANKDAVVGQEVKR